MLCEYAESDPQGYGDFASFYTAGTLVRRGTAPTSQSCRPMESAAGICFRSKDSPRPLALHSAPVRSLTLSVFARWPYVTALASLDYPQTCAPRRPSVYRGARQILERRLSDLDDGSFSFWVLIQRFLILLMGQDAVLLAFLFAGLFLAA